VLTATREGIDVVCGTGVLRILKLQLAGRKPLSAEEFLRGQRLNGTRFSSP
jgi:methionyl-tRNA formyltransferase